MPELVVLYVELTLSRRWSPEPISGVSKLYKALRQGHKRYRKSSNSKRMVIPDPRSIDEPPVLVDT